MSKKSLIFVYALAASYAFFVISTVMVSDFLIELFSPITVIMIICLLLSYVKELGIFRQTSVFMVLGYSAWVAGDIIRFFNHFVLHNEPLTPLVRTLYLFPNYFFGIALVLYMILCLKDRPRDLSNLMVNTFCFSIIGLVFAHKLFVSLSITGSLDTDHQIRALFYFFVNFFIIIVGFHLLYMLGTDSLRRETVLTAYGIIGYILLDFYYTLREATGMEPENIYMNLLYMTFMIMTVAGTSFQVVKKYSFNLRAYDKSQVAFRQRVLYSISALLFVIAAWIAGWLTQTEALYLIITLLAYLIMSYIMRTNILRENLFEQQQQQTTMLEAAVEEKTIDLARANEHLERLSSTDTLTGLYNRRFGRYFLKRLIDDCQESGDAFAVYLIDLNHFKPINDTYGHEMGDRVLKEFGSRMHALPEEYTAFRLGGDEFLIVLEGITEKTDVEAGAIRLRTLCTEPVNLDTYYFNLSGSIGASSYPMDAKDAETLVHYADAAMYAVKHSTRKNAFRLFDNQLIAVASRRQNIRARLKASDPRNDFILYYQPQVDARTGEILGVEVFPHLKGDHENYSPAELIPLAEESGL